MLVTSFNLSQSFNYKPYLFYKKMVQIRDKFFLYMDPGRQWPFYRWHLSMQATAAGIPDIDILCLYSLFCCFWSYLVCPPGTSVTVGLLMNPLSLLLLAILVFATREVLVFHCCCFLFLHANPCGCLGIPAAAAAGVICSLQLTLLLLASPLFWHACSA
jgi:hypothetical protein